MLRPAGFSAGRAARGQFVTLSSHAREPQLRCRNLSQVSQEREIACYLRIRDREWQFALSKPGKFCRNVNRFNELSVKFVNNRAVKSLHHSGRNSELRIRKERVFSTSGIMT